MNPRPPMRRRTALATLPVAWHILAGGSMPGRARAADPAARTSEAIGHIRQRMRADVLAEGGVGDAAQVLPRLGPDGRWPDIAYDDRSVGNWLPMVHLVRLRRIARLIAETGERRPADEAAAQALRRGLRLWLDRRPMSDNWWHNTIGQQRELVRIVLLADAALDADLRAGVIGLLQDPGKAAPDQATGQNLVWYATQQLARGVFAQRPVDLDGGVKALQTTLAVTLAEGLQPDASFHQHGAQLYSGGYGLGWLQDLSQIAAWLNATPWAFPDTDLATLADYARHGLAPLVRGNWLEWGARGRELTRMDAIARPRLLAQAIARLLPLLPAASPSRQALDDIARRLDRNEPPVTGSRAYWRSDFLLQQSASAYFSVKLCSARTVGTESGNGENLQGCWLPFGVTYLLRRGDEYERLPAVWDWACLPGLTAPELVAPLKGYQTHGERFVGVLASEGADGMAGPALATMSVDKHGLRARRSWFLTGDRMVAMGSAIDCTQPQPVWTTLNQCRLQGPVHTAQGRLRDDEPLPAGTRWVWHDGLTYAVLEGPSPELTRETRKRPLSRVNTAEREQDIEATVFMLRLPHGARPKGASYCYAVSAGAATAQAASGLPRPQVLAHSAAVHALLSDDGATCLAVLHEAATLSPWPGWSLRSDAACLLVARRQGQGLVLTLADPLRHPLGITLSLTTPAGRTRTRSVKVPQDPALNYLGSWVVEA